MTFAKSYRLLPLAFPLLLACGGSGQNSTTPDAPKAIPADEAQAATWGFMTLEHGTTVASQMPAFIQAGDAKLLTTAPTVSCITEVTTTKSGITTVVYTFNNCAPTPVSAAALSGSVSISFGSQAPSFYTVEYNNLVATNGTQTWVFNGTKTININPSIKQANLTATNLSAVLTDSAHPELNRSYLYNANLNADWAATGTYKLAGTYSLVANAQTISGAISSATPLTWVTGCCYPTSGSISFTKDTAGASAAFALPCGTLTLTPAGQAPQNRLLPACAQ